MAPRVELFTFRYRDPRTGKWNRARYVATREENAARYAEWEITGPGQVANLPYPAPMGGQYVGGLSGANRFDSLAVSASGRICVATIMTGGIAEFWPDGGAMRFHALPDLHVTNLAFGGDDGRTIYVTAGKTLFTTRVATPGQVAWPKWTKT